MEAFFVQGARASSPHGGVSRRVARLKSNVLDAHDDLVPINPDRPRRPVN